MNVQVAHGVHVAFADGEVIFDGKCLIIHLTVRLNRRRHVAAGAIQVLQSRHVCLHLDHVDRLPNLRMNQFPQCVGGKDFVPRERELGQFVLRTGIGAEDYINRVSSGSFFTTLASGSPSAAFRYPRWK